jgi:pilus assembly protein Flp/PilA
MEKLVRFFKEEDGIVAIEYALIATGIALAIVIVVWAVGDKIEEKFQDIVTALDHT